MRAFTYAWISEVEKAIKYTTLRHIKIKHILDFKLDLQEYTRDNSVQFGVVVFV